MKPFCVHCWKYKDYRTIYESRKVDKDGVACDYRIEKAVCLECCREMYCQDIIDRNDAARTAALKGELEH